MDNEFLTLKEVAEILKVSPVHVQNLIHGGKLKGYKFGGARAMRVQMVDLKDYIGGSQVVSQESIDRAIDFHGKAMDRAVEKKIPIMQAIEELRLGVPQDYKAFMDLTGIGRTVGRSQVAKESGGLRFDTPVSGTSREGAPAGSMAGGDYEQSVEQIKAELGCSEGEAIRLLMQSEEGKKLFESHWQSIEAGVKERSHVYFK